MYWVKQRKIILIILAVVLFLFALFFSKNKILFKSETGNNGLVYDGTETVGNLVNKDSDEDTIPDWEEGLFGTDPTKKETTPGTPDKMVIEQKRRQASVDGEINLNVKSNTEENLTQTDRLSRELFSTVAALNQAGEIDENSVETLSSSLAEKIQNSTPKKVFSLSDMKVIEDTSAQAVRNYDTALNKIYAKYPIKYTVMDVLQKFIVDENTVDESVLPELDPLITQLNNIIKDTANTNVPKNLAMLHLDVINNLQRLSENISDIRQYETDVVVAMSGISQYQANTEEAERVANKLIFTISQRLND